MLVMDIGGHINRIPTICAEHLDSLLLIRCDASTPPLVCDILDISICDHALQHIEKKDLAYANMTHCTKNQGIISVCVYSYENNKIMTHVIEPLKKIFHRLPIPFLNFIARMPAFILFCYTKILLFFTTRFVPEKLRVKFPYYELMRLWIPGGFSKFHEACFDLMHAPISYHFQEHEMRALADANGLTIQTLALINRTMWSMVCIKPTSRQ
ncbi:hypothetical protein LJC15_01630 [Desulfovibrio sp. OttesenSCG-928-G11]|nr:hypothetical protein [Desulfovibrio sp. OttesenSCG-928-G11]